MSKDYYDRHQISDKIDSVKKSNKKGNRVNIKKKNKHWRDNKKRNVDLDNLLLDDEILRIQNLLKCDKCNDIYHNSMETCPYCKT